MVGKNVTVRVPSSLTSMRPSVFVVLPTSCTVTSYFSSPVSSSSSRSVGLIEDLSRTIKDPVEPRSTDSGMPDASKSRDAKLRGMRF